MFFTNQETERKVPEDMVASEVKRRTEEYQLKLAKQQLVRIYYQIRGRSEEGKTFLIWHDSLLLDNSEILRNAGYHVVNLHVKTLIKW